MTKKLQEYTKAEIIQIAADFGAEINPNEGKAVLIAALADQGITDSLVANFTPDESNEDELVDQQIETKAAVPVDTGEKVVIKMTRANRSYSIGDHKFTKDHPFAVVSEEEAEFLVGSIGGFQLALPSEIQKYYA